jgi:hypothetical protein
MNYKVLDIPEELKSETGYGESIISDKCSTTWTDVECPKPATCAEYHWGGFGHKVLFLFCDECYQEELERRKRWNSQIPGWGDYDRGFEAYNG